VNNSQSQHDLNRSCLVCVEGNLDSKWNDYFGDFRIFPGRDGWTLLYGSLEDQSALLGVLARLHGLGLVIEFLVQSRPPAAGDAPPSGGDADLELLCPGALGMGTNPPHEVFCPLVRIASLLAAEQQSDHSGENRGVG